MIDASIRELRDPGTWNGNGRSQSSGETTFQFCQPSMPLVLHKEHNGPNHGKHGAGQEGKMFQSRTEGPSDVPP